MWDWIYAHEYVSDKGGRKTVNGYINEAMYGPPTDTPYGIIVKPDGGYGDILVWVDGTKHIHVVDITNMAVAREIQKAPYQSPDEDMIKNFLNGLAGAVELIELAGLGMLVFQLLKK